MKSYDLHLPQWGPYGKEYLGAAHVMDQDNGLGFQFVLFPGFYRRSLLVPESIRDSGVKVMDAAPDLSRYHYRYELSGKDIYMDAIYTSVGNAMSVTCLFVNHTDEHQSLMLNGTGSAVTPTLFGKPLIGTAKEGDGTFIHALSYSDIVTPQTLAVDGLCLGEVRRPGFYRGSGLDLGSFPKGSVTYTLCETADVIHFRLESKADTALTVEINGTPHTLPLTAKEGIQTVSLSLALQTLETVKIHGLAGVCLDGMIIGDKMPRFYSLEEDTVPQIQEEENRLTLTYKKGTYQVTWDASAYTLRHLVTDDVGRTLTHNIHNHVSKTIADGGKGHYANILIHPIFLKPHSKRKIKFQIVAVHGDSTPCRLGKCKPRDVSPDGKPYLHSQTVMEATTLTNVVYPVYCRGQYILHNTPGRLWDSLYTWDAGFIGMGLSCIHPKRGEECLNTYLTPKGDKHSPFIFHGSVVPTQILLYSELFEKTGDVAFLKQYWDSVAGYYDFFSTLPHVGGLPKTWDIFYNSGGWDDYPAQMEVHTQGLRDTVAPAITASMVILAARVLKNIAGLLGKDTKRFEEDVARYTQALQGAYDPESGYYGYLRADGSLLLKDGVNANMGLDGIYPYLAGVTTPEQDCKMMENIQKGLMTPYGISAVDTRAPYYQEGGYWNGSIWMPHQFIMSKCLLDKGNYALSYQIAKTALDVWRREVDLTGNTYEHFMVNNGRGAGFHQFSGLSTPVLMWFGSYYTPGTVTSGFATLIKGCAFRQNATSMVAEVVEAPKGACAIVTMNSAHRYSFTVDGKKAKAKRLTDGAYAVTLTPGKLESHIEQSF